MLAGAELATRRRRQALRRAGLALVVRFGGARVSSTRGTVVYLRKLRVKNIKLLRDVELDFTRDGEPRLWTVLIGENGLCKTALLQAIALAASGPDRANQLADVPSLCDVRHLDEPAEIKAEFGFGEHGHAGREYPGLPSRPATPPRLVSRLWIEPGWKVFQGESSYLDSPDADEKKDPLREARARGLPGWFAAGYGTSRSLPKASTGGRPEDPVVGRLDTLFGRGELIATNFARFSPRHLSLIFESAVMFVLAPSSNLLPGATGLALRFVGDKPGFDLVALADGQPDLRRNEKADSEFFINYSADRWSFSVRGPQGSQGHQATIAWVSDMIGQQIWDNPTFWAARVDDYTGTSTRHHYEALEGLVLIDELDLHLHPSWQATLVSALKNSFPNVQFIVTTHSPMLLPELERDEVLRLRQGDNGDVCAESPDVSPALMTGSEIYETFFGIDRLYPNELGEALQRYGYLAGNPARSDEEDAELALLREKLRQHDLDPGWEPVPREGAA